MRRPTRPTALAAAALTSLAALTACSSGPAASTPSGGSSQGSGTGTIAVVAGFYPLAYAAQRVGGPHVAVANLTKPGAEPHDAEPTTSDVTAVKKAWLILTLSGFQPSVDDLAAGATADQRIVDAARLPLVVRAPSGTEQTDLHFWLDPTRYADYVSAVAEALSAIDPGHAVTYRDNAAQFQADLAALDTAYRSGLGTCQTRTIVTSHAAFGYLAERYDLTQVAISGLRPEAEPSAKDLAAVANTVRSAGVHTIYAETLVEPKFAQTVASSTGATVAVLDPVEGITNSTPGQDYLAVMRANLTTLRTGQGCS